MSSASPPVRPAGPPRVYNPTAGLLSYLVPGLGQISQGRVAKGLLFLVCIYTLFFYGMYLGSGAVRIGERTYRLTSNVYLPDTPDEPGGNPFGLPAVALNLYNRPQFAGQFWVGIVAWPAVVQYFTTDHKAADDLEGEVRRKYQDAEQEAGENPEKAVQLRREAEELEHRDPRGNHPFLGQFEREPSASAVNAVQNASDKRLEIGWVFTVIAGVLNIMVIYDAIAGPAFLLTGQVDESHPPRRGS